MRNAERPGAERNVIVIVFVLALAICSLCLAGCSLPDPKAEERDWEAIGRDVWIGSDKDWVLELDEDSPLNEYYH